MIPAPTTLMRKALVVDGAYEDAAQPTIRRAEAAAKRIRDQASNTIRDAIDLLSDAFAEHQAKPGDEEFARQLFLVAHDLRGTAAEFKQALIARIAQSMARLMTHCARPSAALLRAHVEALRATEREGAGTGTGNLEVASELARELERRTQEAIDRANASNR